MLLYSVDISSHDCNSSHVQILVFFSFFSFKWSGHNRDLHSFPTRRSSDLRFGPRPVILRHHPGLAACYKVKVERSGYSDRKSTRLNSSHLGISYAVFCLKKKKKQIKLIFSNLL